MMNRIAFVVCMVSAMIAARNHDVKWMLFDLAFAGLNLWIVITRS